LDEEKCRDVGGLHCLSGLTIVTPGQVQTPAQEGKQKKLESALTQNCDPVDTSVPGLVTRYQYDSVSSESVVTSVPGLVTRYEYDSRAPGSVDTPVPGLMTRYQYDSGTSTSVITSVPKDCGEVSNKLAGTETQLPASAQEQLQGKASQAVGAYSGKTNTVGAFVAGFILLAGLVAVVIFIAGRPPKPLSGKKLDGLLDEHTAALKRLEEKIQNSGKGQQQ
jgi:hypothetical protein